jgi:predicted RNA-binding protein
MSKKKSVTAVVSSELVRPLREAIEKRIETENRLIKLAKADDHREDVSYHRGFVNALLWLITDCEDKWPNDKVSRPAAE